MADDQQVMHRVGDIESVAGGFAYTVTDGDENPGMILAYPTRELAQKAAKMMQGALQDATAVLLARCRLAASQSEPYTTDNIFK